MIEHKRKHENLLKQKNIAKEIRPHYEIFRNNIIQKLQKEKDNQLERKREHDKKRELNQKLINEHKENLRIEEIKRKEEESRKIEEAELERIRQKELQKKQDEVDQEEAKHKMEQQKLESQKRAVSIFGESVLKERPIPLQRQDIASTSKIPQTTQNSKTTTSRFSIPNTRKSGNRFRSPQEKSSSSQISISANPFSALNDGQAPNFSTDEKNESANTNNILKDLPLKPSEEADKGTNSSRFDKTASKGKEFGRFGKPNIQKSDQSSRFG